MSGRASSPDDSASQVQFPRLILRGSARARHPETGEQLVRQRASYEYEGADGKAVKTMEHRAGWDATFSAPKSVSLTALVGGDDRVRDAHRESVRVALEQLEHYTQARIGGNHAPETTAKFIAAKFEHDTARPVDGYVAPQLHTHAVIFNMTERENGQYRALQPQSLFASQQFATAVYQSELTYRLRQLGYEITAGRSGAPEIKGYTQEYLDASSPRSQQIRQYLERTGRAGSEAAEIAAHSTRDRKEIHSTAEVMAAHRKLAAEFGHQAEAVVRAARERQQHQEKPAQTVDRVRESLTFSRDKNFEREAVVDERALIRDGLRRGMGDVTYSQVRANLNARLSAGEFQTRRASRQLTGAAVHDCENHRSGARNLAHGRRRAKPGGAGSFPFSGDRRCRSTFPSQSRTEERRGRCSQFAGPDTGYPGIRRHRKDNDALRDPSRRRISGIHGRRTRTDFTRRAAARRSWRRNRNAAGIPGARN